MYHLDFSLCHQSENALLLLIQMPQTYVFDLPERTKALSLSLNTWIVNQSFWRTKRRCKHAKKCGKKQIRHIQAENTAQILSLTHTHSHTWTSFSSIEHPECKKSHVCAYIGVSPLEVPFHSRSTSFHHWVLWTFSALVWLAAWGCNPTPA